MRIYIGYSEEKGYCIIPLSHFNNNNIPAGLQPIIVAVMEAEYQPTLERLVRDANSARVYDVMTLKDDKAQLQMEYDALVQSSDALIDEKDDEIYRMRNLLLWAQNVINGRGFLTHDQKRLMDEIKDVLTAPDDVSVEGDVDE